MGVEKISKALKAINAVLAGAAGGLYVAKIIKDKKQEQLSGSTTPVIEGEIVDEKTRSRNIRMPQVEVQTEEIEYKLCPSCNEKISLNAKFCKYCGNSVISRARYCSNCGSELTEGAVFCIECGEKI